MNEPTTAIPHITPNQIVAINQAADAAHTNAVAHGFHNFHEDEGQFITRAMMLMNTETAELFEAYRKGQISELCDKGIGLTNEEEEIADLVIRAFDYARRRQLNIGRAIALKHAYNVGRPYRHGDKKA